MSTIAAAVKHMLAAGMPHEAIVSAVEEMEAGQSPSADLSKLLRSERNRRYYEKKASEKRLNASYSDFSDGSKTLSDVSDAASEALPSPKRKVSPCTPSKENNPLPSQTFGAAAPSSLASPSKAKTTNGELADAFDRFWAVYPKREGDNPKKPARDKFVVLVKRGVDPDQIIAAAIAYAKRHPVPTQFCKQARFWLNQECFADAENAPKPVPKPVVDAAPEIETDDVWRTRLRDARNTMNWWVGKWGRAPGHPDCRVPAHLIGPHDDIFRSLERFPKPEVRGAA